VCLGYVYKDNESLMGVDILQNEVSVWARLSDCANLLHAWPMYRKESILSNVSGEAISVLQTALVWMKLLKLYFIIRFHTISKISGKNESCWSNAKARLAFGNYSWVD
jgi:hypothetical protein